jgi:hypothetical protein
MRNRRRLEVQKDMTAEDRDAFIASSTTEPVDPNAAEDTDPEAVAAEAERKRLETAAAGDEPVTPPTDSRSQIERQTALPIVLAGDDLKNTRVKMKVLGEERELTVAEVIAEAQKTASADQYLDKAKGLLAEVDRRLAALPPQGDNRVAGTTGVAQPASSEAVETAVGEALDHLFQGREGEAKKSLTAAITAAASQPGAMGVDRERLIRDLSNELARSSALRRFAKDNPDIMTDRIRRFAADEFLNRELADLGVSNLEQVPAEQMDEVVQRAGQKTRTFLGLKPVRPQQSGASGSEANTLSDRRARKATIDELPSAATRAGIVETPPKTTSDTINAMKRARGQLNDPTQATH